MNPDPRNYWSNLRKVPCTNSTGEEIPPYGLVELEGTDDDGTFIALKPRADGCHVFVNGPTPIPDGSDGMVTSQAPIIIATDGTAGVGETWGAQAGSFLAKSTNTGFLILDAAAGHAWADRKPNSSDAAGGETGRWIRIEESTATGASGTWKGVVYDKDGSGGYEDGAAIRATFTPNGGETFINSRDYWATLNGTIEDSGTPRTVTDGVLSSSTTVTSATANFTSADVGASITGSGIPGGTTITVIGSTTSVTISAAALATASKVSLTITPLVDFPLYHSLGSDKVIVPVCRDGNEECDLWILPAPVSITENVDCETGEAL